MRPRERILARLAGFVHGLHEPLARFLAVDLEAIGTIAGYGAVFGNEYDVFGFTESVDPKAFNKSLKERGEDLAVVWSHDFDRVLGTVASNTARFAVDDHGLRYEADLDLEDPDGMSAYRKVKTGKVRQSSFSFEVVRDEWEERDGSPPHRVLREVKLYEASPVLYGANPATQVDIARAARSLSKSTDVDADALEAALADGTLADVLHRDEATTQEPDSGPRDGAPETAGEPEPKRNYITLGS